MGGGSDRCWREDFAVAFELEPVAWTHLHNASCEQLASSPRCLGKPWRLWGKRAAGPDELAKQGGIQVPRGAMELPGVLYRPSLKSRSAPRAPRNIAEFSRPDFQRKTAQKKGDAMGAAVQPGAGMRLEFGKLGLGTLCWPRIG